MATGAPRNAAPTTLNAKLLALGLMGAGFALRCLGYLDAWPNPDEGAYLAIATSTSWSAFQAEIAHHTHPPGIYLLHRALAQIALTGGLAEPTGLLAWLRLSSLLGGSAAIYGVFLLGREFAGSSEATLGAGNSGDRDRDRDRAGLVAAALLAVSPAAVVLSQVLRPYGLLAAALSFGAAALLRYARRGARGDLATAALAFCAASLLHYSTFLVLPAASWIVLRRALADRRSGESPAAALAAIGLWLGTSIALAASHIVPMLLGEPIQRGAQSSWLADSFHASLIGAALALPRLFQLAAGNALAWFALLACGAGFARLAHQREWNALGLAGGTLFLALNLSWLGLYPFGGSRHGFYLVVLLAPVAALGVCGALARGPNRGIRILTGAAALIASLAISANSPERVGIEERLATRSDVAGPLATLEAARSDEGLWLLDRQTYRFLTPYFGRAGEARERGADHPSLFTWFDWGRARVLVAQPWRIRSGGDAVGRPNHVFGALLRASGVPDVEVSRFRSGLLIYGGWNLRTADGVAATPLVIQPMDWADYVARTQPLAREQLQRPQD